MTAEWCSQCRILKSQLKEKVIWMDITTSTPWKEKWVKDHNVDILPGCFVSENKNGLHANPKRSNILDFTLKSLTEFAYYAIIEKSKTEYFYEQNRLQ